jgi:hypothetical protein
MADQFGIPTNSVLDENDRICRDARDARADEVQFHEQFAAIKRAVAMSRETARLRAASFHGEFSWVRYPGGVLECREHRHDANDSTHDFVLGFLVTRHSSDPLEWIASCAHCGAEFELCDDGAVWKLDEYNSPVGHFCCSRECALEVDLELGLTCATCGDSKAVRRDARGNPSCGLLCESRALRARVIELLGLSADASEQDLRDTIPAPPPWYEQDPGLRSADTETAARPCTTAA